MYIIKAMSLHKPPQLLQHGPCSLPYVVFCNILREIIPIVNSLICDGVF